MLNRNRENFEMGIDKTSDKSNSKFLDWALSSRVEKYVFNIFYKISKKTLNTAYFIFA